MPTKRYTVDEKIVIAVAALSGEIGQGDLCKGHGVSASLLYL